MKVPLEVGGYRIADDPLIVGSAITNGSCPVATTRTCDPPPAIPKLSAFRSNIVAWPPVVSGIGMVLVIVSLANPSPAVDKASPTAVGLAAYSCEYSDRKR